MICIITAIERDGLNIRTLVIPCTIPDKTFDLKEAVRKAVADYCSTEHGGQTLSYNCGCFNWADFESEVPNDICRKYGFEKMESVTCDIEVDWDEQLI